MCRLCGFDLTGLEKGLIRLGVNILIPVAFKCSYSALSTSHTSHIPIQIPCTSILFFILRTFYLYSFSKSCREVSLFGSPLSPLQCILGARSMSENDRSFKHTTHFHQILGMRPRRAKA
jgi:hypothetical protein